MGDGSARGGRLTCNQDISAGFESLILHQNIMNESLETIKKTEKLVNIEKENGVYAIHYTVRCTDKGHNLWSRYSLFPNSTDVSMEAKRILDDDTIACLECEHVKENIARLANKSAKELNK